INRLEKRIYDLQLSRQITLQSAPQIRMIQNINQTLAEKIQSSILTSIPLWKNQMAIALTLLRQQGASEAQKKVTDTTNELLLKNSEMLKQNAIRTAEENERGIVDIETLKTTQTNIVDTIQETLRIQEDGTRKRQQAEQELQSLEQDLKTKLLQLKDEQQQLRNTFKS
ncbi:toxic anion resistance protein, partial [Mammaliicoccus sciuri]